MGAVWLGSLPQWLQEGGLWVDTWPGWEHRSRSTGGYNEVRGIGVHHDAIRTGVSLEARCAAAWNNVNNPDRPQGAIWLHNDGHVMIGAAGATNTQGKGGPYHTSKGVVPKDHGNLYILSIEASNNGVGEVWPDVQLDAYVRMCAILRTKLGLQPGDIMAHFEWAPGRKIDPAGPFRYATGRASWNMDKFRGEVWLDGYAPPLPPVTPPNYIPLPGGPAVDLVPITPFRNSNTRAYGVPIQPGRMLEFEVNTAHVPKNAKAAAINIAIDGAQGPGFLTVWPGQGGMPDTSVVNFDASKPHNGSMLVGLVDGKFRLQLNGAAAHIIVDISGYAV